MRWFYSFLSLPFLLIVAIAVRTAGALISIWWSDSAMGRPSILVLSAGFNLWLVFLMLLPAPIRAYVLAHELTHALWGVIMGARLMGMRVARDGGHVKLSEHNVFVALAPYFFSLYTALVMLAYWIYSWFLPVHFARWIWLLAIGASLGFHATFTLQALTRRQTDLIAYGSIFPYLLILTGNLCGLIILIAILAGFAPSLWVTRVAIETKAVYQWLCHLYSFHIK